MKIFFFLLAIATTTATLFQISKSLRIKSTKEFSIWPWVASELRLISLICLSNFDFWLIIPLGYSLWMNTIMVVVIISYGMKPNVDTGNVL